MIPPIHNYFIDYDIVKFNISKMKALLTRDPQKYQYLLQVNKLENINVVHKLDKCI